MFTLFTLTAGSPGTAHLKTLLDSGQKKGHFPPLITIAQLFYITEASKFKPNKLQFL